MFLDISLLSSLTAAPCTVNIKRGELFYKGQFIWIEDFKPNRVLHSEHVVFDCLNKEKGKYYVAERCVDGTLKIPECFKGKRQSSTQALLSEVLIVIANILTLLK